MDALFGVIGTLAFLVGLIWLVVSLIRKKPKKNPGIVLLVGFVLFAAAVALTPADGNAEIGDAEPPQQEEPQQEEPAEEIEPPAVVPVTFDPTDYQNGITYDNLARNPDEHAYAAVAFNGEIVQVIEGKDEIQCRFAVDGDYDKMIFIGYNPDIVDSRVLEGDNLTIYGTSIGIMTYESTLGGQISIPGVLVKEIRY